MQTQRKNQLAKCLETTYADHFPLNDPLFVHEVLNAVFGLFMGRHRGYQACDTEYHDFEHTCQATEALVAILDGHRNSSASPECAPRDFELGVAASLLHDSGYIKRVGDNDGTGAKYTVSHVERSADFAATFLPAFGVTQEEINLVQIAIRCTGINVKRTMWSFLHEREWLLGCALGAGDILGQMAAPDYPERLPALFREYREAVAHSKPTDGILASFTDPEDLMRKTRGFYEGHVKQMLDTVWGGVHNSLTYHFHTGKNRYFEMIEANLDRIDGMLADQSSALAPAGK